MTPVIKIRNAENTDWIEVGAVGATGATGEAGPVGVQGAGWGWKGTWIDETAYNGDSVLGYDVIAGASGDGLGIAYVCKDSHNSAPDTEPGVGEYWNLVWDILVAGGSGGAGDYMPLAGGTVTGDVAIQGIVNLGPGSGESISVDGSFNINISAGYSIPVQISNWGTVGILTPATQRSLTVKGGMIVTGDYLYEGIPDIGFGFIGDVFTGSLWPIRIYNIVVTNDASHKFTWNYIIPVDDETTITGPVSDEIVMTGEAQELEYGFYVTLDPAVSYGSPCGWHVTLEFQDPLSVESTSGQKLLYVSNSGIVEIGRSLSLDVADPVPDTPESGYRVYAKSDGVYTKDVDGVEAKLGGDGSVPAGGDTDQILAKVSATDYDTAWIDAPTGGVPYTGATGDVNLGAHDFKVHEVDADSGIFSADGGGLTVNPKALVSGDGIYLFNADGDIIAELNNLGGVRGEYLVSAAVDGDMPVYIDSTTLVEKLNADMLDGHHAIDFAELSDIVTSLVEMIAGAEEELILALGQSTRYPLGLSRINI